MNWYSIFYWLTVVDGVKKFFDASSDVFTTFTIILFIPYMVSLIGESIQTNSANSNSKTEKQDAEDADLRAWKKFRLFTWRPLMVSLTLAILTWVGFVFTPSKKDALIIIAGGAVGNFITHDTSAKQIPAEAMNMLRAKIQEEIHSASITKVKDSLEGKSVAELKEIIRGKEENK